MTINHAWEVVGLTGAADVERAAVISPAVETDGSLATGQSIGAAIGAVDAASRLGAGLRRRRSTMATLATSRRGPRSCGGMAG